MAQHKRTLGHTYLLRDIPAVLWENIAAEAKRTGIDLRLVVIDRLAIAHKQRTGREDVTTFGDKS